MSGPTKLLVALAPGGTAPPAPVGADRYVVSVLLPTDRPRPVGAIVEVVMVDPPAPGDLDELVRRMPELTGGLTALWVHERVKLDGERVSDVKAVYFAQRREQSTRAEFDRHWDTLHAPLALTHHIGMCRYVQNAVVTQAGELLPEVDGVAELWFPTMEDFRERLIDSPEGMEIIRRDIERFALPRGLPAHLMAEQASSG
jgi:uncharacterized protein (TIGR02118 family)